LRDYIDRILVRSFSEESFREPRVRLFTLHGSKGLEADCVAILADWGRVPGDAVRRHVPEEDRLAFVAVTRAREEVVIVDPHGPDAYLPLVAGGADDLSNLQPLQWEGNRAKGDSLN
jgi:superfamily I DNA/RNA helicase